MKINQIICQKRKELSMTQEQVANYLGVSAPAVNKWEKGSTYPDITILPALARLLKTDLNTLLSFHDDLTDIEIENFVTEIDKVIQTQNYETAFQMAVDKIQEYPACENLLYSVSLYLEGCLFLYHVAEREPYQKILETFYQRMTTSENPKIKNTAISMLISYNRNRGDFSKAEELIHTLPSSFVDTQEHLAVLYTQQEKYTDAEKIWEQMLLNGVTKIQSVLINMMEIALKENRTDDAVFFADRYEAVSKEFCLPEWMFHNAHLLLAIERQDKEGSKSILKEMLPSMKEDWNPKDSRLYQNIDGKTTAFFTGKLADTLLDDIKIPGYKI